MESVPRACRIESLEARRLFTGFYFQHHQLGIAGSTQRPNTITVGLTADGQSIDAEIRVLTHGRYVTFSRIMPLSLGIRLIMIRGGKLDDTITIDQTNGPFPIRAGIIGGDGFDTISGGDEPDLIYGGRGDDSINGGAGNDTLRGQAGDDILNGDDGNDVLLGGAGRDQMIGGNGNDTLADARGPDVVLGGAGNNTFWIHSFAQDYTNDYDKTKDKVKFFTYTYQTASDDSSFLNDLFPIDSNL